ncbi:cell division protein FtsQ/DivIB [Liquorilactobacillus oeni]|uniref:Cell division protein DivIB n=1 Tax=Liquorilactobacillus oeni DSM 19972 TaxID=1423777 RepID=A0A0R1M982_9LACO|nr:cell division protein FtsQ/DivIB [Liquorilactobacillus oeni]KRL04668.1 cell division protein [Liquorilactobacillus oeni DSM 19972]
MKRRKFLKKNNVSDQPLTPWERVQKERRTKRVGKQLPLKRKKRIGDKLPRLVRQRNKVLRRQLFFNLLFFVTMALISLYFILPVSRVQKIEVSGMDLQTENAALAASGVKKEDQLLKVIFMQKKMTENITNTVAEIKNAEFKYQWTTVKIKVIPNTISGYVLDKNRYYSVTQSGKVSKLARNQPEDNYPVYSGFGNSRQLVSLANQMKKLPTKLTGAVSEVHYAPSAVNPQRIQVYMNDGNEVIATISTFAQKMPYYSSIKAKATQKIVVDFEVGAFSYPKK